MNPEIQNKLEGLVRYSIPALIMAKTCKLQVEESEEFSRMACYAAGLSPLSLYIPATLCTL